MATEYNFPTQFRGATAPGYRVTLTWEADGQPVDLTGADVAMKVRQGSRTGTVYTDLTLGSGIAIVDAVNGVIDVEPFPTDTYPANPATSPPQQESPQSFYHDLLVTLSTGMIDVPVFGILPILESVTAPGNPGDAAIPEPPEAPAPGGGGFAPLVLN